MRCVLFELMVGGYNPAGSGTPSSKVSRNTVLSAGPGGMERETKQAQRREMMLLREKAEALRRLAERAFVISSRSQGEEQESRAKLEQKVKDLTAELSQARQELDWEHIRRTALEEVWVLASRVFEKSPDHISIVGRDYTYQQVNPAYEVAHGIPADNLIGRHVRDFLGRDTFERIIKPNLDRCLAGQEVSYECWFEFSSLGRQYMAVTYTPLMKNASEVEAVLVIARDITRRKQAETKLRESEARFQAFMNHSPVVAFLKDQQGRYLYVNEPWELCFNRPAKDCLGKTDEELFPPEIARNFRSHDLRVLRKQGPLEVEERTVDAQGEQQCWWVFKFPVQDGGGEVCVGGVALDITARKQAERALREAYEFNHEIISSAREGIIVYDTNLRYRIWNRFMEEFTDLSAEEVLGAHPLDVFPHLAEQGIYGLLEQALAGKFVSVRDIEFSVPSTGKSGWISARFAPLKGATGNIIGVIALISDITERKQAEKALLESRHALEKSRGELRALTGKLFTAQEEERRRIARDLHDDFNQRLASLSIEVDLFERFLPPSTQVIRRELVSLQKKLAKLSDDVHQLAYELHPSVLDDLGLEAAIRDCVGDFQKRTGIRATFTARNLHPLIAPEFAGNLFRVTQESLRNVARHAKATTVRVNLCGYKKCLGLSIKDNGKGFDLNGAALPHGRLGLISMQERVRLMKGELWVRSAPGKGTRIGVWVSEVGKGTGHQASA